MTLDEYVDEVKQAMQRWLDIHFDFDSWLEHWFDMGYGSLVECMEKEWGWKINITTDVYSLHWDVMELVAKEVAKLDGWLRCPECGDWDMHSLYCGCDTEPEPMDACDVEDRLRDIGINFDYFGEEPLRNALKVVWNDYYSQTRPFTEPIKEDIETNLVELETNPTDEAIAWANHLMHVSGYLLKDYSNIEWNVIQAVSEQGLSYFGETNA